jgi:hypothetical protein
VSSKMALDNEPKKPVLNVRLVRGVGKRKASGSRVRGRLGRFGEENGRAVYVGNEEGSSQQEEAAHESERDEVQDDADDLLTPRPSDQVPQWITLPKTPGVSANAFPYNLLLRLHKVSFLIPTTISFTGCISGCPDTTILPAGIHISRYWCYLPFLG